MTTKIHDVQGRPLRFLLTGGQIHGSTTAADLSTISVVADKAYDNNVLRDLIDEAGAEAVIPSLSSRKIIIPHDRLAYRLRNRIERFFHYRHIATRDDRRAVHFVAALHLASAII